MIHSTRNRRLATLFVAAAGLGALAPGAGSASNASAAQDQFYVNPSTGYATPAPTGSRADSMEYRGNAATGGYASPKSSSVEPQPAVDQPASPTGFDWPSAGIGGAAVGGLLLVLLAAHVGMGSRGRGPLVRRG
jgi:hypothetical protein